MAALPYIQLYVADYLADTIHLTTEEHGAYMLLIFNYWQTGKPLPANRLASISKLNERWTDVEQTLAEFFELDDNGHWYHERIEMDLNKVKSKSIQASKAGKLSAAKRAASKAIDSKGNSNGRSNAVERESNHTEADTDTEANKEKNKPKKTRPPVIAKPDDVEMEVWQDWLQLRKTKKASVTNTVLKGARKESEKAGLSLNEFLSVWCVRGSQGLEASWLTPNEKQPHRKELNNGYEQKDTRSRAKKVSDKLDEIARRDIEENGYSQTLD